MNESKVVRYDLKLEHCDLIKEDRSGRYVTHADYKALEEKNEISNRREHEAWSRMDKAEAELASLKARVAELVESDRMLDVAESEYREVSRARGNWNGNPVPHNHPCILSMRIAGRMRQLALEALK